MNCDRKLQICAMARNHFGHDTQEIYDILSAIDPDIDGCEVLTAAADAMTVGSLPSMPNTVRLRSPY